MSTELRDVPIDPRHSKHSKTPRGRSANKHNHQKIMPSMIGEVSQCTISIVICNDNLDDDNDVREGLHLFLEAKRACH